MTSEQVGDLGLGKVLEAMCNKDDDVIVLKVLQVLGHVRRSGYMSDYEQVMCLSYCANRFADTNNYHFFDEFVQYMPDISINDVNNPFTPKCKTHYFASKQHEHILNDIQSSCNHIDVDSIKQWFREYLVSNNINNYAQILPLINNIKDSGDSVDDSVFKSLCTNYHIPFVMKTGSL